MRIPLLLLLCLTSILARTQIIDSLNTAKNCSYMSADEREMIYEINRVRSNPKSYLVYINPLLIEAREKLKKYGKGPKNYSLTYSSTHGLDKNDIDTTWHYRYEEEVKALNSLVADLSKLKKLSVLQPDTGIYKAACKHAEDQRSHEWKLGHTGTDGSNPWDRITRFSPAMSFGNENIAGNSEFTIARDIVIQLLVDDGISGYGHRYNLLDPQWTHVACKGEKFNNWMNWWLQEFGSIKK